MIRNKMGLKVFKRLNILLVFALVVGLFHTQATFARIIDKDGKLIVPFLYDSLWRTIGTDRFRATINNKEGVIDKNNNLLVPISYFSLSPFGTKVYIAAKQDESGNRTEGIIDYNNNTILEFEYIISYDDNYNDADDTSDDRYKPEYGSKEYEYAEVRSSNGKHGYADNDGNLFLPCKYDELHNNGDGYVTARKANKWGILDRSNREVIPFSYDGLGSFDKNGLAVAKQKGKWGFINKNNEAVIPFIYDNLYTFDESGLALAKQSSKWGFINKNNEIVIPFEYDDLNHFSNYDYSKAKKSGKFGFIDKNNNILVP